MTVGAIQTNGYSSANSTARTASAAADTGSVFSALLRNSIPESAKSTDYDAIFQRAAKQYGVPVNLLKAVAKAESNYNAGAVSRCGALGVMQLMPATAKGLGVTEPLDAEQNIMGGAKYLSDKLKQYDGSVELALAAYNAGSGNVAKYGGVPPFEETQNYIGKVLQYAGMTSDTVVPAASAAADSAALTSLYALSMLGGDSGSSNSSALNALTGLGSSSETNPLSSLSSGVSSLADLYSLGLLGNDGSSSGTLLSSLSGSASPLTSLYALRMLGNTDSSGGTQNTLAGLLGTSGTAGLTSQNYLSLLQMVASQMQLGSTQPLAGDLTDSLSGSAGSML